LDCGVEARDATNRDRRCVRRGGAISEAGC
jgi:hypothetical protein